MIKKKNTNQEDINTWEEYIKDPSNIYDKDQVISNKNERRGRYKFDLHGFTLEEANSKAKEIIVYCIKNKFRELLLITGKGKHSSSYKDAYISKDLGKLKYSVPYFLKNNNDLNKFIISINEAEKNDGGEGALIINFKNL